MQERGDGSWRLRAGGDGKHLGGPWRESKAEVADDLATARRSTTRADYMSFLQGSVTWRAVMRESAPVRRRPAQSGAASSSVPQPVASVRARSRSRRGTAAQQEQSGTKGSSVVQPAAVATAPARESGGGMWRRSLSVASSRRGGAHSAQALKRPRVSSPGAGEG